ncbi:MAG TPA: trigger factor [Candidatus Saccharimonadales bacterium]|nr:trigger factor [Candidatus Saccharimonadales bacterium]
MRIQRTNPSDTKTELTISADQAFLDNIKQQTLKHLSAKHVKLPGFREGKAPLSLVEKNTDPEQLQSEFLEEAVNRMYVEAIKAEQLRPVAQPDIQIKKFVPFTDLEVSVTVEVIGKVTLPDYTKIKKTSPKVDVTAQDVNDVVESLRKRLADKKDVARPAKDGDEAVIDFKGTDDKGQAVNGAEGKDFPLVLGSNTFIPGFEPNLIGLKAGENKTFTLKFPKDYGVAALASKDVTFAVTMHKVQELSLPKVDDVFASKAGPFETLKDLKADIKQQLTSERQNEAQRAFENELIQEIASQSKVSLPKTLVDQQVQRAEDEERQNLTYRGQTWQEHLKEEGITEEEHRQRQRPAAKENIKASLVLSEIAAQEGVTVTPEELEIRVQILKGQYQDPAMQTELDKPENRQDVESRIMTEKTIAKLVEYTTKK